MGSSTVSGHPEDWVEVITEAIVPQDLVASVAGPRNGAVILFLGTVRDHSDGKEGVTHLEYEAYRGVVEDKIRDVVEEARDRWPLDRVAAVHRIGTLTVGEISVAIAVGAGHRSEVFDAGRYLIDELKRRAPIWKKEHWPGGAEWVREDRERSSD